MNLTWEQTIARLDRMMAMINHKEAIQELPDIQSSGTEHNPKISLGNFVEQVGCVSTDKVSDDCEGSKVPSAAQIRKQRRITVQRSYHKVRKRRMKRDHRSQSLHLAFRILSPRNQLHLGDDSFNSMAVNMANENQNAGTRRARFMQRFYQFQKRRARERYRVVIASFRSKYYSWVVAKKVEKNSLHTFLFPPRVQFSVSVGGDVIIEGSDAEHEIETSDVEIKICENGIHEDNKLSGVIAKPDYRKCLEECYKGDSTLMMTQRACAMGLQNILERISALAKDIIDGIVNARKIQGIEVNRNTWMSMVDRVFVNGKQHCASLFFNRVWEPGDILAEQVLLEWLVSLNCGDRKLLKQRRSHEIRVPSEGRQCYYGDVLALAILFGTEETLHYNLALADYIWEPGGLVWIVIVRSRCMEFQKDRIGDGSKVLVCCGVHKTLEAKLELCTSAHHSSKNQKLLITLHGLGIKELSWINKISEKSSMLEILFVEIFRCKAYIMELEVVGEKVQTSQDVFPNWDSYRRGNPTTRTRELLSEFSLANRVWEPGWLILLLVKRVQWVWFEDVKQITTNVKMRSENKKEALKNNGGMAIDDYLEDKVDLKRVSKGMCGSITRVEIHVEELITTFLSTQEVSKIWAERDAVEKYQKHSAFKKGMEVVSMILEYVLGMEQKITRREIKISKENAFMLWFKLTEFDEDPTSWVRSGWSNMIRIKDEFTGIMAAKLLIYHQENLYKLMIFTYKMVHHLSRPPNIPVGEMVVQGDLNPTNEVQEESLSVDKGSKKLQWVYKLQGSTTVSDRTITHQYVVVVVVLDEKHKAETDEPLHLWYEIGEKQGGLMAGIPSIMQNIALCCCKFMELVSSFGNESELGGKIGYRGLKQFEVTYKEFGVIASTKTENASAATTEVRTTNAEAHTNKAVIILTEFHFFPP